MTLSTHTCAGLANRYGVGLAVTTAVYCTVQVSLRV
jgi:hypothetical protein